MKNTRRIIDMKIVEEETIDIILGMILSKINDSSLEIKQDQRYKFEIPVEASTIRREYIIGNNCLNDMVSEYDLFKKKRTITEVIVKNLEIQSITIVDEY